MIEKQYGKQVTVQLLNEAKRYKAFSPFSSLPKWKNLP